MMEFKSARKLLLSATGFDIGTYNPDQMTRLLTTLLTKAGVRDLQEYVRVLKRDVGEVRAFKNAITINVSEFFRDKHPFEVLQGTILPMFFDERSTIQVWSAGCAGGEEPYSLAILLEENKLRLPRCRILATDIDEEALANAEAGVYHESALRNLSPNLIERFFERNGKQFKIGSKLAGKVKFARHNLLDPIGEQKFDLILCRNVVIYFAPEYKTRIYENLVRALRPGGVLFIGSTETLLNYRELGLEKLETYFYRKPRLGGKK